MAIPDGSNYPLSLDTETELLTAHDSLRLRLAKAYAPGATSISVEGDFDTFNKFPNDGFITLTEQCSDIDLRALTFHYTSKTAVNNSLFVFSGLELEDRFTDVEKPEKITNVTQNVVAANHNQLVDALIEIEKFIGKKGTTDTKPFGETMEGRINFLHNLVLQPKAWFTADKTVGLVPFEVTFTERALLVGQGCPVDPVVFEWDFGDQDCSVISFVSVECPRTISVASVVPVNQVNVNVLSYGGSITKTYTTPNKYDVTLKVTNKYGTDTVVFPGFITAKIEAPTEATITIDERAGQNVTQGSPSTGPYVTNPSIRSPVDTFIDFTVNEGVNPATITDSLPNGRTYGGELADANGNAIDPITDYTWDLSDDLRHGNARTTRASYSVGGLYDLVLRVDTQFDSYRITTYENAIDIVEKTNLWLWTISNGIATASEFGLISETFKTSQTTLTVPRETDFLEEDVNSTQQIREFKKNSHFTPASSTNSGSKGTALLYWAGGRSYAQSPTVERINVRQFNGFNETYMSPLTNPQISRPWNWVPFTISGVTHFALGGIDTLITPFTSPTNQEIIEHNLSSLATSTRTLTSSNYKSGADELQSNVVDYDGDGQPKHGHFCVYRSAAKESVGYMARNSGIGEFFRIRSFYKTEGVFTEPIQNFKKLDDIAGTVKSEGELLAMTSGVYFFNNSGSFSLFDGTSESWKTSSSSTNSASFSSLQDKNIAGFSNTDNTLVAASDGDRRSYLSYDYSVNAFIKFNEASLTFNRLPTRPSGEQWIMGIY